MQQTQLLAAVSATRDLTIFLFLEEFRDAASSDAR
jgi:hypothetical protein